MVGSREWSSKGRKGSYYSENQNSRGLRQARIELGTRPPRLRREAGEGSSQDTPSYM